MRQHVRLVPQHVVHVSASEGEARIRCRVPRASVPVSQRCVQSGRARQSEYARGHGGQEAGVPIRNTRS
eukprot:scaffold3067_cov67-Phaeocystis_antarctica.AAC.5